MNVVKILLILGLGYIATTQKSEKTRNMLLVVTGLLAFCMFSVEGFDSITFTKDSDGNDISEPGKITDQDSITKGTIISKNIGAYIFPDNFVLNTGLPVPDYACGEGKVPVTEPVGISGDLNSDTVENAYPCSDPPEPQKCSDSDIKCDCGYSPKDDASCESDPCVASDFKSNGNCCGDKPNFCECLKTTDGNHIDCNSGWVIGGKYIKKNSEGTGWVTTNKYWDEDNYKCWPMALEDLWGRLGIFSGKCVVPSDTPQSEIDKCDPPSTDKETTSEPADGGHSSNDSS